MSRKAKNKLYLPPKNEWDVCVCTNTIRESPNGRHSKDLMPKSKPKPLGGKGAKGEIEEPRNPHGGKRRKPDNVFDDELGHIRKSKVHN